MNEYWIGYGLLHESIAWLEDERAGNYFEEMDYRQSMHFLAQSYSSRLGECGGGGGGNKVENGQTKGIKGSYAPIKPSQIIKNWSASPLSPGLSAEEKEKIQESFDDLNLTLDGRKLLEDLYIKGDKIEINFISGANIYTKYCTKGTGVLSGLFSIEEDRDCLPIVYIANELLDEDFDDWKYWGSSELLTLGYVLVHEFAHYDFHLSEGDCWNNYNSEMYAISYMHSIFLELNTSIQVYDIFNIFNTENYNNRGICGE